MISGQQIRMARAALKWTIDETSQRADVGVRTIKRIEAIDEIAATNVSTILKLKSCLESAGIEFIGTPDDGPGIRIRTK